jgi:hypothetical protein
MQKAIKWKVIDVCIMSKIRTSIISAAPYSRHRLISAIQGD